MKVAIFCALFFVSVQDVKVVEGSSLISAGLELCGAESELELTTHGEKSAAVITLAPLEHFFKTCKLKVSAPKSHIVNMQFVETTTEIQRAFLNGSVYHPPCPMTIFLPDSPRTPFWKGDPCSENSLPEIDLLTSEFKILWHPPMRPHHAKGRKIVINAVGQGKACSEPGQHPCMKIGRNPILCVSEALLCDGQHNCPKSSSKSDEDDKLCKGRSPTRKLPTHQIFFDELRKTLELPQNRWLKNQIEGMNTTLVTLEKPSPKKVETSTAKPIEMEEKKTESISSMLAKYGPWGYLMLGMLICGTVLMFCGLWECCIRKPKTEVEPPPPTPPTTVLIINHPEEVEPVRTTPPNYDDLDQPPSYTTLFPNLKLTGCSSVRDVTSSAGSSHDNNCVVTIAQNSHSSGSCNSNTEENTRHEEGT